MPKNVRAREALRSDRPASAVILCLLAVIGLSVWLKGRAGPPVAIPLVQGTAPQASALPSTLLDSHRLAETRTYSAENLYEYINGQAPLYIEYGFKTLTVGEYAPDDEAAQRIVVDLYDMAARRNAYGVFADSFPPEEERIALGNAGFASSNVAVFWKAQFYVRVSIPTDADVSETVLSAARSLAEQIEDDAAGLREFAAFPAEGLVPDSLTFVKSSAFGLGHLREAFIGDYEANGARFRLFFCDLPSEEASRRALKEHEEFLRRGGTVHEASSEADQALVWGTEKYVGATLLIRRGNIVAGAVGLTDRGDAERRARDLLTCAAKVLSGDQGED